MVILGMGKIGMEKLVGTLFDILYSIILEMR